MPGARSSLSTAVVNAKIYVIGGSTLTKTSVPTVEEYDPATDTWTRKADMPTKRAWLSTNVVNGKIYAIGSIKAPAMLTLSTVEEYDPATDIWTTKSDMPTARCLHSSNLVNGKIYAIGGAAADIRPGISTVEEYDPATDTWTTKTDMPTARKCLSTSIVNGKIYAIGGGTGARGPVFSTVEEYDPATDTWTKKADMPTARWFLSTSVVNGKIYAIGGDAAGSLASPNSTVEEYDPNPLVVDFNDDGIVDSADMCMMVDHWHTDEPFYDIGPTPLGDGIVDVQDLIVLAEYLFTYPGAVAYWKLDETEGDIAYDSVGVYYGVLNGVPMWQPTGGMMDGALELDGIDDCIVTDFVLNPADGEFSVFAWIKGGAPGQVVLSQMGGVNWLCADTLGGKLMTGLKATGRSAAALLSQTNITDGNWHCVGFVWDGAYRALYVDDILVAEDTQTGLASSIGGLNIGCGSDSAEGTFWSGLIDDIRIYNRVVSP